MEEKRQDSVSDLLTATNALHFPSRRRRWKQQQQQQEEEQQEEEEEQSKKTMVMVSSCEEMGVAKRRSLLSYGAEAQLELCLLACLLACACSDGAWKKRGMMQSTLSKLFWLWRARM
jgi:superfamily II DNA helicase RecQ